MQRAVSCVSTAVLTGRRYHEAASPHVIFFARDSESAPIGRLGALRLSVRHYYRFGAPVGEGGVLGWQTRTAGYVYELLDDQGNTIVAYHWHPIDGSPIDYPHLHIGRQFAHANLPVATRGNAERLVRCHLPTERVVLPTVLRLVVDEWGVIPLREDWPAVLDETERALRQLPPAP